MSKINKLLSHKFDVTNLNIYINGTSTRQTEPKLILTGGELIDNINSINIKIKHLEECKTTMETILNDALASLEK